MQNFTRIIVFCLLILSGGYRGAMAQSVLNPNDPVVTYNSSNPPTQPPYGQIGKWVRTVRLNWNTSSYKCYIYKGVAFRLKFPKTYNSTANDGKKYPMLVFWHGLGESGTLYDNEYQLYHGGDLFRQAVEDGTFDGYVIAMQALTSNGSFFSEGHYQLMQELIDYMVVNNKLDPFRVVGNGLSAGGAASWDMFKKYPAYMAALVTMSAIGNYSDSLSVNRSKFTPIWYTHGGLDNNPAPGTSASILAAMNAAGAHYNDLIYPSRGHDVWNATWAEPDFWPYVKRAYASNPWPLFGRTDFCPHDPVNVIIGVAEGYDAYEWRKDGVLIPGATTHSIQATGLGTFDVRVLRGGIWSDWSHVPVQIRIKPGTVSPNIRTTGLASRVLPALDGSTSVQLEVPDGFTSYDWRKEGSTATLGTARFLTVTTTGDYQVKVTEQYGCSSDFSALFRVVDANGTSKPDPATGLAVTTLSNSSLRLDWSDNPGSRYNETEFEIYRSPKPGGPYTLAGITGADVRSFTVTSLASNTRYYYTVRAVNNTGAADPSTEASGITLADSKAPTAPQLCYAEVTKTTVTLSWTTSLDDAGIARYEIYINGKKTYITTQTSFLVSNLQTGATYNFTVLARDLSGNASAFSNQVTLTPSPGLNYRQYIYTGSWSSLPNFATRTPVATGTMPNVLLTPRTQSDRFAFLWEGSIRITLPGTYYFQTGSDAGSRLWLGPLNGTISPYSYSGTPVVNNDGLHAQQDKTSGPVNLMPGIYPIAVAYYDETGSEFMALRWKGPQSPADFIAIPDSAFAERPSPGQSPAKPSNLTAKTTSYREVDLAWTDNSNNESGFEIYRSLQPFAGFTTIARVNANATSYRDTALASNTRYYYRIKAVNDNGASGFDLEGQGVNYTYYEQSGLTVLPDFNTLTPVKTGRQQNFGLGMQQRADNFQLRFTASVNIPSSAIYSFFLRSDDGAKLYIDGFDDAHLVINNDSVHTVTERSGARNLSKGVHTLYVAYFESASAEELSVNVSSSGLPRQSIPDSWLGAQPVSATTLTPAPAPVRPASLVAKGISTSSIQLDWLDKSSNEKGFEIYRSAAASTSYVLYATVGANITSFVDEGLFTNAVYYYKVRALGDVNHSLYSNEDSAKTWDVIPVITQVKNRTARYGQVTSILVRAKDADGDALSFTAGDLPAFAVFTDLGDNTAILKLSPSATDQGLYAHIQIAVRDNHGGSDTTRFDLTVNDNHDPLVKAVADYMVNEGGTLDIPISASDPDTGDLLTWTAADIPLAFTLTPGMNGNANLQLRPNFNSGGMYVIYLQVEDNRGGASLARINLTAADAAPAMPSGLAGSYRYDQGVKLTWKDLATNETGFEVYRGMAPAGPFDLVGRITTANETNYTDNGVSVNTQYYYKIRAINANDASGYSNVAPVFTNRIPEIAPLANVFLKSNQSQSVAVSVADDPTDHLVLTTKGLPGFARLVDNGNGTGTINIQPGGAIGSFDVTLTARDKYDSSSTVIFRISVVDKDLVSVYLNFTDNNSLAGKPWNNITTGQYAGTIFNTLRDDGDNNSSIVVTMQSGWGWVDMNGMRPGNGLEVYPESVLHGGLIETSTAVKRIVVSNLSTTRKYNFVFFNSYDRERNGLTNFTINGKTVSLDPKYNSMKTVQINGIIPDATGKVNIDIARASNSDFALLNAMVIQSYAAPVADVAPADLRVTGITRNSIALQWQDRSDEQSTGGFQIWRNDTGAGAYTLVASVGQNVTTYTDVNLAPNKTYYYTVRAKRNGTATYSSYSNVACGTTCAYSVYINFNNVNQAGMPWNHTNTLPQLGYVWNNFSDEQGVRTSLGMETTSLWSGLYSNGVNTGNNSGIFPDNVMIESYGLFPGVTGTLKITGLDVTMKYNLTFFASANDYSDITVAYVVNGRTLLLNASLNKSGTVTLYGVAPDENGEVQLSVAPGTPSSQFGLIGALVIQGFTPASGAAPLPSSAGLARNEKEEELNEQVLSRPALVYPNPFQDHFDLSVMAGGQDRIQVVLYDLSGKRVYSNQYPSLREGMNTWRIETGNRLIPGIYFAKVSVANKKEFSLIKVIKQ